MRSFSSTLPGQVCCSSKAIIPGLMENIVYYGGIDAARKLLTPLLKPLLGLPGNASVALVGSLQSTDTGAVLTNDLYQRGQLNEKQLLTFAAFQFSCGAPIGNMVSAGAAMWLTMLGGIPLGKLLGVVFLAKFIGANIMRLYAAKFVKEEN